jgi:hypothetical protein
MSETLADILRTVMMGQAFMSLFLIFMVARRFSVALTNRRWRTNKMPLHILWMAMSYLSSLIAITGSIIQRFGTDFTYFTLSAFCFYTFGIIGLVIMMDAFQEETRNIR